LIIPLNVPKTGTGQSITTEAIIESIGCYYTVLQGYREKQVCFRLLN